MRRLLCAVTIGILLSVCAGVLAAEKAETNPAEQSAEETSEVSQDVDTRLAEKVTYNGGYKRLREVVADLSAMTGVTIRCGRTDSDWQSRDVPVFVSVTDMPLGRLLNLLADCTHQGVFGRHIGANEPATTRTYRIYRDNRRQADLDAYRKAQEEAVESTWDMLVKLANTSDLELELKLESGQVHPIPDEMVRSKRAMGRVLAHLDEAGKESVLAGDVVVLKGESLADTSIIRNLYMRRVPRGSSPVTIKEVGPGFGRVTTMTVPPGSGPVMITKEGAVRKELQEPSDEDVWRSAVAVQLSGDAGIRVTLEGKNLDWYTALSGPSDPVIRSFLESLGEPSGTNMDRFESGEEYAGGKHHFLLTEEDWDQPILHMKVEMQMPEGGKPTYADVLAALSEATGFDVVIEDFESHRYAPSVTWQAGDPPQAVSDYTIHIANDTTIGGVLKKLMACHWAVDADSKQIVGVAKSWRKRHLNLVPQNLLVELERKSRAGAGLEDLAPALALTPGQVEDWITWSSNLRRLERLYGVGLYWKLYGHLSARQRALAMSAEGLPLAIIDGRWLASFLREHGRHSAPLPQSRPRSQTANEHEDEALLGLWAVSDAGFISSLTMKVIGHTSEMYNIWEGESGGTDKTAYRIELHGEIDEHPIVIDGEQLSIFFPVRLQ